MEKTLFEIISSGWFIFGFIGSVIVIYFESILDKPSKKDLVCLFFMTCTPLNIFLGLYGYMRLFLKLISITHKETE